MLRFLRPKKVDKNSLLKTYRKSKIPKCQKSNTIHTLRSNPIYTQQVFSEQKQSNKTMLDNILTLNTTMTIILSK